MHGNVHITPVIWIRDGDRSPICLGDADDLADWLGRTCASLMRSRPSPRDRQVLELEALLARVEAAIDADVDHLPAELRRDIVAAIARLNGVSVAAAVPDRGGAAPATSGPAASPCDRHRTHAPPAQVIELRRLF
ncbi:hypothetical protein KXS07_17950 [Inquilinus limosus]|uniref:hypothetical protein n=1 Tax=Inquilinus limosus TaxID=171674 RepID=UPI003F161065